MPRSPVIAVPFSNSGLVPLVVSHPIFAQRGYLWGFDGSVHYCFFNPDKIRFEIWKKEWHIFPFLVMALSGVAGSYFFGLPGAFLGVLWTAFIPFLLYKHYYKTAAEQVAAVVTNGPQMRLPFDMQFDTVAWIAGILLIAPPIFFALIGYFFTGTVLPVIGHISGWVVGAAAGALTGINLFALFMFLLGLGATPYGSVIAPSFPSELVQPVPYTHFFGRALTTFNNYVINKDNPSPGLTWASGGLEAIIINGVSAGKIPGQIGSSYRDLVANPRELVVWGLIPLDLAERPILREAITSQEIWYRGQDPVGLIVVAGSKVWINAYTLNLLNHNCKQAVATDGSQSALLGGSSGDFVVGGGWNPLDMGSYRDSLQRYGFMGVPE